jgi:hypothetical protein
MSLLDAIATGGYTCSIESIAVDGYICVENVLAGYNVESQEDEEVILFAQAIVQILNIEGMI